MEKISFRAKDGVEIVGLLDKSAGSGAPAVLLLHMMPAVKESWQEFQEELRKAGFQYLAIDLRGHGESVWKNSERIDYKNFTDTEQQEKIYDVEAAISFLKEKGIELKNIALAGASIGANLALQYQAEHPEIKAAVLLSPGLDYRGIKAKPLAQRILPEQSVFLVGAKEDLRSSGNSCADMAEMLFNLLQSKNKKLKIVDGQEHGTDMFHTAPEIMDEIVKWLREIYFDS